MWCTFPYMESPVRMGWNFVGIEICWDDGMSKWWDDGAAACNRWRFSSSSFWGFEMQSIQNQHSSTIYNVDGGAQVLKQRTTTVMSLFWAVWSHDILWEDKEISNKKEHDGSMELTTMSFPPQNVSFPLLYQRGRAVKNMETSSGQIIVKLHSQLNWYCPGWQWF